MARCKNHCIIAINWTLNDKYNFLIKNMDRLLLLRFHLIFCRFNAAHIRTRVVLKGTFGQWKNHLRCLHWKIDYEPPKVAKIIIATACLHNIAISKGDLWLHHEENTLEDQCHDPQDNFIYRNATDNAGRLAGQNHKITRKQSLWKLNTP